ncbi:hypothetical protein [Paenibacillus ginsengihumi]|uniref:hypothetical protein n=1 Tax=Paenibacillus ginsengihumi TaxID=431596 RepID=UPI0012EB57CD|nr:hypothetical protein [Paenibacillus ginsengihumi]
MKNGKIAEKSSMPSRPYFIRAAAPGSGQRERHYGAKPDASRGACFVRNHRFEMATQVSSLISHVRLPDSAFLTKARCCILKRGRFSKFQEGVFTFFDAIFSLFH